MYTLKKLLLEEGKDSLLPTGYSSELPNLDLFKYDTEEKKSIASLDEVSEGWQVILYSHNEYHRTSKISEIISREPNKVTFKTQTSIYELTLQDEEES